MRCFLVWLILIFSVIFFFIRLHPVLSCIAVGVAYHAVGMYILNTCIVVVYLLSVEKSKRMLSGVQSALLPEGVAKSLPVTFIILF